LTGTSVLIEKPFSYRLIARSKFLNSEIKKRINEHRRHRQTTVQQKTFRISAVFDPVILLSYAYTYWSIRLIVMWPRLLTIRNIQRVIGILQRQNKKMVDYITRVLLKQEVWLTGRSQQEYYRIEQELKTLPNKIKTKIKFYRPFPHIFELLARKSINLARNQEIGRERLLLFDNCPTRKETENFTPTIQVSNRQTSFIQ
jgi:hypothetical protein